MKEALSGINSAVVIPWLAGVVILCFLIFGIYKKNLFVFKNAWRNIFNELADEFSLKGLEIINLMIEIEIASADDKGRRTLARIEERAALTKDSDDFYAKILKMVKEIREASYGRSLNGFYEKTKSTVMQADSILKKYASFDDKRTLDDFAQFAIEANQAQEELTERVAELTCLWASITPKNELLEEESEEPLKKPDKLLDIKIAPIERIGIADSVVRSSN